MKMNLMVALGILFGYNYNNNNYYGFSLDGKNVFTYEPAEAENLFLKLANFFTFASDRFAPPRLEAIGWGARGYYDGVPYDEAETLCFVRDYIPDINEVVASAAMYGLDDFSIVRQRLVNSRSWEIYIRYPQKKGFYRFCERLAPLCNNS